MKTQAVRLLDIWALGPFMVWYAVASQGPKWARVALLVSGVATVLYNGRNYTAQKALETAG